MAEPFPVAKISFSGMRVSNMNGSDRESAPSVRGLSGIKGDQARVVSCSRSLVAR